MNDADIAFDRPLTLAELLPQAVLGKLWPALAVLAGADLALQDCAGQIVAGALPASAKARVPVILELEPLGYLVSGRDDKASLRAAALLLIVVLRSQARYRMAADLHTETVTADYQELQRRHAALAESEAKYRELSAQLEQRVEAQVQLLDERQRQLYQAEKLASIGQLAAGVAHEINNPIGFVRSNLNTGRQYLQDLKKIGGLVAAGRAAEIPSLWQGLDLDFALADFGQILDESIGGIDRVARIVRDLRGFSNIDQPEEAVVDLNETLANACQIVAALLPPGVTLQRDFQPLPPLMCLPGHLSQVFLNLLTNAMQAVAGRGTISVASAAAGDGIEVRIGDDGCGIAADQLTRVFDPFFSTRDVGQGTGLGLTVARDIVHAHGGRIAIESTPGAGTAVTVSLPT